ncbi:PAS domain-containing hybrid sensor histidine kinase/response regulator [Poseidonocella sp. HB161398]|uniref:hybrid sensor histidine kinase/response regulator n=1 Tax=Poseidonocella sp. HB161398 TaxID=2320855 RepID=UPI001109834C|nr:PAS domain-containing hybrid sensor histidine kinase/response regulator [Poseidonocella sp. HB161398]
MAVEEDDALADALGRQRTRSRLWTGLTALSLVLCIGLVAGLAGVILREIDELSTANSDNLQWTFSQADVEFLRFQRTLERAATGRADVGAVRRRFDIFYSRMTTLETGEIFYELREDPEFAAAQAKVAAFLERTAAAVDSGDAALAASLPDLVRDADAVEHQVRTVSIAGLSIFAAVSDQRRTDLTRSLTLVAAVLGVLLSGMAVMAATLFVLGRMAEDRTRAMQQTAARMRMIVETSHDAIIVADAAGRIEEFNPAAERIFGYFRSEARGRRAVELLFPPDTADDLNRNRLHFLSEDRRPEPNERQIEVTAVDSMGRPVPVEFSVDRAEQEGGNFFVALIRDITRRKEAEAELTEARDRALAGERTKAEFLAVMSHEMRTPLNGLLGSMELLRDHAMTERQSELLDRMQSSGRSLLALVNDVLDLAKFEAGKMEPENRPFSISRLLDGVVETAAPLAAANGNTLGWDWASVPLEGASGDPRRLRQILLNLVGNSVKFTRGGSVDIEAEITGPGGGILEIRVIDTGIGISAANLERIFNDFETLDSSYARQAGGTGLGLGISRRLAELLGGEIGAESEPGEGSLFWLRVPITPLRELPLRPAEEVALRPSPGRSLDLLVVEDNEINRFVVRQMLEADGHRVTEAVDGGAGVEWAAAHRFDAILMDISMPVMDGPEATRRIRTGGGASANVPIVAVTAHALPAEIARFREAGMAHCLSKPIDRQSLAATLAEISEGGFSGVPAAAEPVAEPVIDAGQLGALCSQLGAAAAAQLFERFVAETDGTIDTLAGMAPDSPDLAATAHSCAGSCATFGMAALRGALARIETSAKTGRPIPPAELEALPALWADSRAAGEAQMQRLAA